MDIIADWFWSVIDHINNGGHVEEEPVDIPLNDVESSDYDRFLRETAALIRQSISGACAV